MVAGELSAVEKSLQFEAAFQGKLCSVVIIIKATKLRTISPDFKSYPRL